MIAGSDGRGPQLPEGRQLGSRGGGGMLAPGGSSGSSAVLCCRGLFGNRPLCQLYF